MSLLNELLDGKAGIKPEDENEEMLNGPEGDDALDEEVQFRAIAEAFAAIDTNALNEGANVIRLNKVTKTANLASRMAIVLARTANDPLYTKYAKFNGLRLSIREAIYKKYGSKANMRARALMSGTAKALA